MAMLWMNLVTKFGHTGTELAKYFHLSSSNILATTISSILCFNQVQTHENLAYGILKRNFRSRIFGRGILVCGESKVKGNFAPKKIPRNIKKSKFGCFDYKIMSYNTGEFERFSACNLNQ